ncbi:MAG: O-antigen ligase family protein [Anaerolineae bacterium]|nr:O-antigen ligase family protein [Anaerolineae bacterium]
MVVHDMVWLLRAIPEFPGASNVLRSRITHHAVRVGAVLILGGTLAWLPLPIAVPLTVGSLLVLLVLLHPVLGLFLLIPVIPFSPLVSIQVGGMRVGGMEALLGLTLAAWLLRMASQRQIILSAPLGLPWLLWLATCLFSWTQALSLGAALSETAKWVEMLTLYLFVVALVGQRHIPWLVTVFLVAALAQAVLGIYQSWMQVGPEGFLIFEGQMLRAYGTFQQPNPYAGYLGLTLPLAYSISLWGLGRVSIWLRAPQWSHILLVGLAAVTCGGISVALYASQSRGAWLGALGALITTSLVRSGRAAILFGFLIAALFVVVMSGATELLPPGITQRFAEVIPPTQAANIATVEVTDANFPVIERLAHWQAALDMWRDHLWLGVGLGNYPVVYPLYAIGRWRDPLGHAHNFYLNVAAETGLVGLLLYGALWGSLFWLGWQAVRTTQGAQRAIAAGILGMLVALSVHHLVDNLFVQGMYLHVAAALGILEVLRRTNN